MLSIEEYPPFNGQPPAVAARFTYIEPTYEIMAALNAAGVDATKAFRSVSVSHTMPEGSFAEADEADIEQWHARTRQKLLLRIGGEILAVQEAMTTPKVEVVA